MYESKILADSISPEGYRLTTFEVTFPRFILAEVNTHRMLSRNSASSRAIPIQKSISALQEDPFIPASFPANKPGMQGGEDLDGSGAIDAATHWYRGLETAMDIADELDYCGVHKAWANRILEPYKWHTAILTATDWDNFFALRTDENAQPEFRKIALMMQEQYDANEPTERGNNHWHLPLVDKTEDLRLPALVSAGRCARVSYLTHDGQRDPQADIDLAHRLQSNGHLSPFEHVATPFTKQEWEGIFKLHAEICFMNLSDSEYDRLSRNIEYDGNLHGWHSYRSFIPNQDDFSKQRTTDE